jgi:hypothetical protein
MRVTNQSFYSYAQHRGWSLADGRNYCGGQELSGEHRLLTFEQARATLYRRYN